MVLGLEGSFASNQLVDGHSQGPKVDSFIVASSNEDFRGLVKRCPNHGQHVSAGTLLKSLFADIEVDDFYLFRGRAVEDIFRLDISMTDIMVMEVLQRLYELFYNFLKLHLSADFAIREARFIEAFHHQIAAVLLDVQIEGFIFDQARMVQPFQIYEIPFQVRDVLLLNFQLFGRIDFSCFFVPAAINASIGSLPQLLQKLIFLQEKASLALPRRTQHFRFKRFGVFRVV